MNPAGNGNDLAESGTVDAGAMVSASHVLLRRRIDSRAYLKRGHWLLARDGASDASYSRSISVVEYGSRSRQFAADRRARGLGATTHMDMMYFNDLSDVISRSCTREGGRIQKNTAVG